MENETTKSELPPVPAETQEAVKTAVQDAFRFFASHTRKMAEDFLAFQRKREEISQRMKDGAKRTTGRIV